MRRDKRVIPRKKNFTPITRLVDAFKSGNKTSDATGWITIFIRCGTGLDLQKTVKISVT